MSSTAARESSSNFQEKVLAARGGPLAAEGIEVLQVNLGFRCNMACKHCHVEAGPARGELMGEETAERVISVLAHSDIPALDLTGGAPELNPQFSMLVAEARRLEKRVIARSNLTIFFEEGMEDLPEFYAEHGVEVVASLPYYMESGVDRVRGEGTFRKSIEALRKLNSLGFGADEGGMLLNLVYNPPGAFLPPAQETLEGEYKRELGEKFGISFSRLFTLDGLMCRHLLSVGWDGSLYDCDFNLVLGLKVAEGCPENIGDFDLRRLSSRRIAVGDHCFGCTAGQGST
ncbi:MAG: radical SAM/Cys-rich domain protein [Nitrospirota bacterium]